MTDRNIPEDEYCTGCPCCFINMFCMAYRDGMGYPIEFNLSYNDNTPLRLPQCLKEKPRIMTIEDREMMWTDAWSQGRNEKLKKEE